MTERPGENDGKGNGSVERLEVGPLATCCYVVTPSAGKDCVLIDPGADGKDIVSHLRETDREPGLILLTHSHYDHVGAVDEVAAAWPEAAVACHAECARRIRDPLLNYSAPIAGKGMRVAAPARSLEPGEEFTAAGLRFKAFHLPGHAPGHLVYHVPDLGVLFCGDTVFAGGVGRSDLPGGDHELLVRGVLSLLRALDGKTVLYPGHGPATTVAAELASNPFLRS